MDVSQIDITLNSNLSCNNVLGYSAYSSYLLLKKPTPTAILYSLYWTEVAAGVLEVDISKLQHIPLKQSTRTDTSVVKQENYVAIAI